MRIGNKRNIYIDLRTIIHNESIDPFLYFYFRYGHWLSTRGYRLQRKKILFVFGSKNHYHLNLMRDWHGHTDSRPTTRHSSYLPPRPKGDRGRKTKDRWTYTNPTPPLGDTGGQRSSSLLDWTQGTIVVSRGRCVRTWNSLFLYWR